jgi:hypothetical protein
MHACMQGWCSLWSRLRCTSIRQQADTCCARLNCFACAPLNVGFIRLCQDDMCMQQFRLTQAVHGTTLDTGKQIVC